MSAASLRYGRHFALLTLASVAGELLSQVISLAPLESFGWYAAIHATAFIASLRGGAAAWRYLLFIALAVAVCMGVGWSIVGAGHYLSMLPTMGKVLLELSVISGAGAFAYAVLIRIFWMGELSLRRMGMLTLICVCGTMGSLSALHFMGAIGSLWRVAVVWWFVFSAGLWHFDLKTETC